MIVYISGKITGTDDYVQRFAQAEKKLRADGHKVINPARRNAPYHFQPWEWYMKRCVKWLCDADAIYLLKGWKQSKGAVLEHQIAVALGIEIITEKA